MGSGPYVGYPQGQPWGGYPQGGYPAVTYPLFAPPEAETQRRRLGTWALGIGIAAALVALIPLVGLLGIPLGLIAMGIAFGALVNGGSRGQAIAGFVAGLIALPLAVGVGLAAGAPMLDSLVNSAEYVRAEVRDMETLLADKEFPADKCIEVDFAAPDGRYVDYTARNTCDETAPAGLFIVDAIDGNGHVFGSGWGDFESLDASGPGTTYDSYVFFDVDVSRAAKVEIRDLDANNALYDAWWDETPDIEA